MSKFKQAIAIDSTRHDTKWCLGNAYTSQVPPPAVLMPVHRQAGSILPSDEWGVGAASRSVLLFNVHGGGALRHVRLRNRDVSSARSHSD